MKTTISGIILGGVMACTLAACNTTPMNNDSTMGSSSAGTTTTSSAMPAASGDNAPRGATPINCTTNTNADGTKGATVPGTNCPAESQ